MLKRVLTAAVLLAVLCAALWLGRWAQCAVFTFAAVVSVYELSRLFRARGRAPFLGGAYAFAALHYVCYLLLGAAWLAALGLACLLLTVSERIFNKKRATEDAICSLFVFIYPLLLYAILMVATALEDPSAGRTALLLAFAGPLLGDTLAFAAGSLLGRHKLCPEISPKKTVEGSVGGLLGGVAGGLLTYLLQGLFGGAFPLLPLLLMGLLMGGLGQIGDLFASTLKRWAAVKDYGGLFPGHGGVMDRLDSVLMCAPVLMIYFKVIMKL